MGLVRRAARFAAASAVVTMIGVLATAAPGGAVAGTECSGGYDDFGPITKEQGLQTERIQAGLNADPPPYTVEELSAVFDQIDANDDGLICLNANSNLRGNSTKQHAFFYLADDNDHP